MRRNFVIAFKKMELGVKYILKKKKMSFFKESENIDTCRLAWVWKEELTYVDV